MLKIEEAIVNLLLRHNCVIVPAFGGFVAQSSGAVIDMNSGVINPPRKSVLFNKQLINNDGLLISHISSESDMDYQASEDFLKAKVAAWHEELKAGKRVSIDKIGHLFLDAERNISFEQDRFFNLLLQSYGLNKVHFISDEDVKITGAAILIAEEKESTTPIIPLVPVVETEENKVEKAAIVALVPEKSNRKMWKYVAAAVLLPFAFFTYWIPVETTVLQSGMISFKDFNPMYKSGEGVYQQAKFSFPETKFEKLPSLSEQLESSNDGTEGKFYKFDDELILKIKEAKPVSTIKEIKKPVVEKVEIPVQEAKVEVKKPTAKKMHYITGCFSSRANAQAMVETLNGRGLKGYILDEKNGMTRVSAGGANNEAEFDQIVKKVQALGYQGWKFD